MKIRQEYKDALIYGTQEYQPKTGHPEVAAYVYRGAHHKIITAVNCSENSYSGNLELENKDDNGAWTDLIAKQEFTSGKNQMALVIGGHQLRVLVQTL